VFRKLISIIFLVFLLSGCERVDHESALAAYEAGNYETAFKEYLYLAEKGDAQAQHQSVRPIQNRSNHQLIFPTSSMIFTFSVYIG